MRLQGSIEHPTEKRVNDAFKSGGGINQLPAEATCITSSVFVNLNSPQQNFPSFELSLPLAKISDFPRYSKSACNRRQTKNEREQKTQLP